MALAGALTRPKHPEYTPVNAGYVPSTYYLRGKAALRIRFVFVDVMCSLNRLPTMTEILYIRTASVYTGFILTSYGEYLPKLNLFYF